MFGFGTVMGSSRITATSSGALTDASLEHLRHCSFPASCHRSPQHHLWMHDQLSVWLAGDIGAYNPAVHAVPTPAFSGFQVPNAPKCITVAAFWWWCSANPAKVLDLTARLAGVLQQLLPDIAAANPWPISLPFTIQSVGWRMHPDCKIEPSNWTHPAPHVTHLQRVWGCSVLNCPSRPRPK